MKSNNFRSSPVGETTDVEVWLLRAGLRFEDLGSDDASTAIRMQWREYQAAVQKCCAALRLSPERVQLCGVYTRLRIPNKTRREKCEF